jgi:hypothetical protein
MLTDGGGWREREKCTPRDLSGDEEEPIVLSRAFLFANSSGVDAGSSKPPRADALQICRRHSEPEDFAGVNVRDGLQNTYICSVFVLLH